VVVVDVVRSASSFDALDAVAGRDAPTVGDDAGRDGDAVAAEVAKAVLIVASVPYEPDRAMALWSHLECLAGGIDEVLIAAPDAAWSRKIVGRVLDEFERLRAKAHNETTTKVEEAYYVNDRYDVGLWCDGLSKHFGFHGIGFAGGGRSGTAVFLINDSSVTLRQYRDLTDRILAAAKMERRGKPSLKLVSLNGNLVAPGGAANHYWVESVYRGLTPGGVSTFHRHSCISEAARACKGKTDNAFKQCIVEVYEMSLAQSYRPEEVDAMYPSYLPKEWDASSWENSDVGGQIGPTDQWIRGRRYFRYLVQEREFSMRKVKWPRGQPAPPRTRCLELLGGETEFFEKLPYPTEGELEDFRKEMLKREAEL
ncbi:hypothetical protein ACHAWF_010487, partial [Thalassiosira exigua]